MSYTHTLQDAAAGLHDEERLAAARRIIRSRIPHLRRGKPSRRQGHSLADRFRARVYLARHHAHRLAPAAHRLWTATISLTGAALIAYGFHLIHPAAGYIIGGLLLWGVQWNLGDETEANPT